ncbi:MAG: hypothetical protein EOP87_00940 [Verrucomicrobiaceae bacterium]|nr:MAG: hypothetical protein EOP87_00940 [Verrucomicrobiaceae bacterium]
MSGLGRAFRDVTIRPGAGKKFLTIPACAETYGRRVGEFPPDEFKFAILYAHRPFPVLLWRFSGGKHKRGDLAYWLRRSVVQKQDRTLLPSDEDYQTIGRARAASYILSLRYNSPA